MDGRGTLAYAVMVMGVLVATVVTAQQPSLKKVSVHYISPASPQEMYTSYCAACHGMGGRGNGPAAPALKVPPSDLATLAKRNNGTYPSNHVMSVLEGKAELAAHGSKEMPIWGPIFMELGQGHPAEVQQRANNLTKYIESFQIK